MKTVFALLLTFPLFAQTQNTSSLAIDAPTSLLRWTGHAEVGSYAPSGTLHIRSGEVRLHDGQFAGATLLIDMNSMDQSNGELLHHLKSSDFFDVERYPTSKLSIDRVANGVVAGTLTIKGKSAPIECQIKTTGNNGHFTITGKAILDRTKYGIVYNSTSFFSGLGNQAIRNTFEVEFTLNGTGTLPGLYRF